MYTVVGAAVGTTDAGDETGRLIGEGSTMAELDGMGTALDGTVTALEEMGRSTEDATRLILEDGGTSNEDEEMALGEGVVTTVVVGPFLRFIMITTTTTTTTIRAMRTEMAKHHFRLLRAERADMTAWPSSTSLYNRRGKRCLECYRRPRTLDACPPRPWPPEFRSWSPYGPALQP